MQPSMKKVTDGAMENPTATFPSVPSTSDMLTSTSCSVLSKIHIIDPPMFGRLYNREMDDIEYSKS